MNWRKSSYSYHEANCVEVDDGGDPVVVRDSKAPAQPALWFTPQAWATFVEKIRHEEERPR